MSGTIVRVLIVKLSSLGDVVHAMPVVHDLGIAFPGVVIDWVVEPAFAPLVRRVAGVADCIECPLRRWTKTWWTGATRAEWRGFWRRLRAERYDAVLDLQGLTKSAVIARLAHGMSYGLANRTDGAGHEPPARWLVDRAIAIAPRTTAVDRSRELAARALGYAPVGPPVFGLRAGGPTSMTTAPTPASTAASASVSVSPSASMQGASSTPLARPVRPAGSIASAAPVLVFIHGSSRDDKLWPEPNWFDVGRRAIAAGWRIALPQAGAAERARAERLFAAFGGSVAAEIWPAMALDKLLDRLAATQGTIGVDSGLSHIAVALDLPHVQIYNFPTAWRTGPPAMTARHAPDAAARTPASAPDTAVRHRVDTAPGTAGEAATGTAGRIAAGDDAFGAAARIPPGDAAGRSASRQLSVEATPWPTVDAVWSAWLAVLGRRVA